MSSKNYYVNGNTVRELDTPVRHNQRTRKEIEEARRRKNRRNAARRNRQRAMEMSPRVCGISYGMCSDHCTDCRFVCTNAVADDDTNEKCGKSGESASRSSRGQ